MGVSLRLEEHDASGNIKDLIWMLEEAPSETSEYPIATTFDLGYPTVKAAVYDVTEGNGSVDLTRFHGSSTVTIDAQLIDVNRWDMFDRLKGMCHPRKRVYLFVKRPEWTVERRIQLRANNFSFVSDQSASAVWKVALAWTNPSGVMESVELTTLDIPAGGTSAPPVDPGTGGTSGYGSGSYGAGSYGISSAPSGLSMLERLFGTTDSPPITSGYGRGTYGSLAYGSDSAGTENTTDGHGFPIVKGNIPVQPQMKITGPCTDPVITFDSIGTSMVFRGLEILEGDYLLIDIPSKQILMNGDIDQSYYSTLSLAKTDGWNGWPYLDEGRNTVDFTPATSSAGCVLTLTFRDAWI